MKLEEFTAPVRQDFDPRPNASQAVAAQKRRQAEPAQPQPRRQLTQRQQILAGSMALLIALAMIGISYQLSGGAPKALATPQPTIEATSAPALAAPTMPPAPTSAPTATIAPTASPTAAEPALTGRGLTLADPPEASATPESSYIEIVGQQAPHSPRGDGQAGPSGGDWVAVPTVAPAQLQVIQLQAPHKVR